MSLYLKIATKDLVVNDVMTDYLVMRCHLQERKSRLLKIYMLVICPLLTFFEVFHLL